MANLPTILVNEKVFIKTTTMKSLQEMYVVMVQLMASCICLEGFLKDSVLEIQESKQLLRAVVIMAVSI